MSEFQECYCCGEPIEVYDRYVNIQTLMPAAKVDGPRPMEGQKVHVDCLSDMSRKPEHKQEEAEE